MRPLLLAIGTLLALLLIAAPRPSRPHGVHEHHVHSPGHLQVLASTQDPVVIRIEMTEFAFHPAVVRLPRGRMVRLTFVNRGSIAHQFEADDLRRRPVTVIDQAVRVESPGLDLLRLQPGGSASLQFLPRTAGRFVFACTIEGHREAGMTGLLLVR